MSAICGLLRLDGRPVTAENLRPAMEAVAQYGRDGSGVWTLGAVGFGHRLMRLTPESAHEQQPITRGNLTLTADARIDNRDELFAELSVRSAERSCMTDGELVLLAYTKWREDCPKHLIGDYAFAIWDEPARRLFCARDHIGARPFFYYHSPALFAFATDIRGVLAFPGVPAEIDEVEVAQMLLSESPGYHDNEHTFFRDVRKLTFGHYLTVDSGTLHTKRYWRPEDVPPLTLPTTEDYAQRLHDLVRQAVADRLRTDKPTGAHLSGGLDSSSIAVLAAQLLRERGATPPAVFSWSPPPGPPPYTDEHKRIEAVCRQEGLAPIYNDQTEAEWNAVLDAESATRPVLTVANERHLQRRAELLGVRVILSGWGGDEAASFNGRGLLAEYVRNWRWGDAIAYLRSRGSIRQPRSLLNVARVFWRDGVLPLLSSATYERFNPYSRGPSMIREDFLERIRAHLRQVQKPPREVPGGRQCQWQLYYAGHITARIESWAALGADCNLVYGYPLLDRRVLEFVYAIPVELHARDGRGRYLCRKAMEWVLPPGITNEAMKQEMVLEGQAISWRNARLDRWAAELGSSAANWENPWVDIARLRGNLTGGSTARRRPYGKIPLTCALTGVSLWRHWKNSSTPSRSESYAYLKSTNL
ncbi:MAG: asparagine synthase-related protein [Opitutaceae bacterium]|nr:asparagine synthase-related protein [Opitutaceae bacterium]